MYRGSLGAKRLNESVATVIEHLFEQISDLYVVHQVGRNNSSVYKALVILILSEEFISGLYRYTGAADVVITRSGANTVAELAVQAKPIIIIPNAS